MHDLSWAQGLIIDLDGVLWRGHTALPGVPDFFQVLRRRSTPLILATNNSTISPQAIQDKLRGMGAEVRPEEVITSAEASALWLADHLEKESAVYSIGEAGLHAALAEAGFSLAKIADGVGAVVVGMNRQATWADVSEAVFAIHAGALFVGTNPDATFPSERGLAPGAGTLLAAIQTATGVEPTIIGKPEPHLFQQALARLGSSPETTLALGDRLETDILGAQRAGIKTALVLTGVTQRQDLKDSPIQPDWVFDDLPQIVRSLSGDTA
jgi:4-nitrophenyl phosphatase